MRIKYRTRLFLYIYIPIVTFALLLSSFGVFYTIRTNETQFINTSKQIVSGSNHNFINHLDYIKESSHSFSNNEGVIDFTKTNEVNSKMHLKLITFANSFPIVSNVTIYSTTYDSSYTAPQGTGYSSYPKLSELLDYENFNVFYTSDNLTCLSIRKKLLPKYYDWSLYSPDFGIITIFSKIIENDNILGIVSIDINPNRVYQRYFSISDYKSIKEGTVYLSTNHNDYLYHSLDDTIDENLDVLLNPNNNESFINDNFILVENLNSKIHIINLLDTKDLNQTNLFISLVIAFSTAVLLLASFFVVNTFTKKVSTRLDTLKDKMSERNLDL